MADVRSNQRVYTEDPQPYLPQRQGVRGPKVKKRRSRCKSLRVDELFDAEPSLQWRKIKVHPNTKGDISVWTTRQRNIERSIANDRFPSNPPFKRSPNSSQNQI